MFHFHGGSSYGSYAWSSFTASAPVGNSQLRIYVEDIPFKLALILAIWFLTVTVLSLLRVIRIVAVPLHRD